MFFCAANLKIMLRFECGFICYKADNSGMVLRYANVKFLIVLIGNLRPRRFQIVEELYLYFWVDYRLGPFIIAKH